MKENKRANVESSSERGSWAVAKLLRVSSGDRIEDVEAYVSALETIVFEVIARNVAGPIRGVARETYKRGVAAGLQGCDSAVQPCAPSAMVKDADESEPQWLGEIQRAGVEHGRSIRRHIAQGCWTRPDDQ
ncbi:hypothetical protein GR157_10895 [Burkholderia sp. 4701]|nr:hypothetical protein [Burkholderia sp. 4701]MXN82567.1 hypothetical protein [Burkholderia sp. 4812]